MYVLQSCCITPMWELITIYHTFVKTNQHLAISNSYKPLWIRFPTLTSLGRNASILGSLVCESYSGFSSKVGTIPPKSGRLDTARVLEGYEGMLPRKKIWKLRSSNCWNWKCTEIVNLTITTLFCIILNILRSHQADLFGSLGGGGAYAPCATLPCYGPKQTPA